MPESHETRNLILEEKTLTGFAGWISGDACKGDKLVDLTQNFLGGHQTELIRLRRYSDLAFGKFPLENTAVEVLKFQTG